ncbi:hypothetical protein [Moorella sp. E306M]|uniref:hypothetical protein n=1 Tax=Moorella sp. E306M TaxID=2572683 RepID=UPI0010FFC4AE|nr:hypothetical protein [Moorella sp. E306M]GEA17764.1 hypothetical protein E306M_08980 [Moorella sp. E306M]GEA17833.1 hypothetical protein E306M_09670 [Moorella sp. E306M]
MRPEDLTKEVAEKLLAAGISKKQMMKLYGFMSVGTFYYRLTKWGLHKKGQEKPGVAGQEAARPAEPAEAEPSESEKQEGITVSEALQRLQAARENVKCLTELLEDVACERFFTREVIANLEELRSKYTTEATRIEQALSQTRVVI